MPAATRPVRRRAASSRVDRAPAGNARRPRPAATPGGGPQPQRGDEARCCPGAGPATPTRPDEPARQLYARRHRDGACGSNGCERRRTEHQHSAAPAQHPPAAEVDGRRARPVEHASDGLELARGMGARRAAGARPAPAPSAQQRRGQCRHRLHRYRPADLRPDAALARAAAQERLVLGQRAPRRPRGAPRRPGNAAASSGSSRGGPRRAAAPGRRCWRPRATRCARPVRQPRSSSRRDVEQRPDDGAAAPPHPRHAARARPRAGASGARSPPGRRGCGRWPPRRTRAAAVPPSRRR